MTFDHLTTSRWGRLGAVLALAATLTVASSAWEPTAAQAQDCAGMPCEQVEPGFKGVIGLGMVGAELGFIVPAVAGLHETWAFIVFPVVGAAGGAIGGYFALEQTNETTLSVAALSFGMAMIIPTMVITLAATAYDPEEEGQVAPESEDFEGEFEEGVEGDVQVETETSRAPPSDRLERARTLARAGGGLFRWSERGLLLAPPALALRPTYTAEELQRYGGEQQTELRVPVFTGTF